MANTAAAAREEQHFVLLHLSPSLAQERLSLALLLALLVAFVITVGPLSTFQPGRFGELAADLVRRRVNVIVTLASATAALAAKAATTTIPIEFWLGRRPGQGRLGRQLQSTRRQSHRRQLFHRRTGG